MTNVSDQIAGLNKFSDFAGQLKSFEKVLYGLVASSAVFSAMGAVVTGVSIGPGLAAFTLLVGTIGGIMAILTTFLARTNHPAEELDSLLDFRARQSVWPIARWFLLSIGLLCIFYPAIRSGYSVGSVFLGLATFSFFRGLVMGMLSMRAIDMQQSLWDRLPETNKQEIVQAERGVRIAKKQYTETLLRMHSESQKSVAELKALIKEGRRRTRVPFRRRVRTFWQRLLARTEKFRFRMGGHKLLTRSESSDRSVQEILSSHYLEVLEKIKTGELEAAPIDDGGVKIYKDGNFQYFVVDQWIDRSRAENIIKTLEPYRASPGEKLGHAVCIIPELGFVDVKASELFLQEGITLFRTIDQKLL